MEAFPTSLVPSLERVGWFGFQTMRLNQSTHLLLPDWNKLVGILGFRRKRSAIKGGLLAVVRAAHDRPVVVSVE